MLYPGVLARDHAAAGVEIGAREGDAHRSVGVDCRRAQAEIDLAAERRRKTAVRLHDDELDLFRIAKQILGDFVRHIDLEADQLAVIVDICERRRSAVGSYDQLVTLQDDIEQRIPARRREPRKTSERNLTADHGASPPPIAITARPCTKCAGNPISAPPVWVSDRPVAARHLAMLSGLPAPRRKTSWERRDAFRLL